MAARTAKPPGQSRLHWLLRCRVCGRFYPRLQGKQRQSKGDERRGPHGPHDRFGVEVAAETRETTRSGGGNHRPHLTEVLTAKLPH